MHGIAVHPPLLTELHVIADQCGAQSATSVTRCGLNVDLLEATVAQDFAVRHAVKGNPASQAQVPDPGLLAQGSSEPQHDLIGHGLDRSRQVHVVIGEELVLPARVAPK